MANLAIEKFRDAARDTALNRGGIFEGRVVGMS